MYSCGVHIFISFYLEWIMRVFWIVVEVIFSPALFLFAVIAWVGIRLDKEEWDKPSFGRILKIVFIEWWP